jgi:predicted aldo/keto reductase-like oxidoreductase
MGSTDVSQQYDISRDLPVVKRYFEDLLRIFGGYIDFGMLFFIDSDRDYKNVFETGFADYALSRPTVASVLIGCKNPAEVDEATRYLTLDDSERDYSKILSSERNDFKGNCVYCGHCQPCPLGIGIASVNKYLDIARLDTANIPPSIKSHYSGLEHSGEDCIVCGNCESRCPFDVPIIANMREASELLGRS